jgi:hypothetical protein
VLLVDDHEFVMQYRVFSIQSYRQLLVGQKAGALYWRWFSCMSATTATSTPRRRASSKAVATGLLVNT